MCDDLIFYSYADNGLQLLEIHEEETDPCTTVELKLTPNLSTQPDVLVQCPLDHPFFVRDKGAFWSVQYTHNILPLNILIV